MVTVIPGRGGGWSGFRVTGMIQGFFGVGKFWQVFFWVFKTYVSLFMLYHLKFSGNSCLGNSARDFWGLKFWSRDFLGVSLEALGNFFFFWFLPPFNHPHHLKSGVPPWYIFFLFHFLEEHFLLHVRYKLWLIPWPGKIKQILCSD